MPSRPKSSRIFRRLGLFTIIAFAALSLTAIGVGAQGDSVIESIQAYLGIPVDTLGSVDRTPSLSAATETKTCVNRNKDGDEIAGPVDGNSPAVDCPITVLPNDGSTSGNARAPSTRFAASRSVYLITAGEMAAAGYANGQVPTTIGWDYQTAPGVGGSAPLKVYLQNTADTSYSKGTSFATAITGMTLAHNANTALPAAAGTFDITLAGGTPFTYTGGGVYVAYDWGAYAGTLSTTTVIFCNTALGGTNGLAGNNTGADAITASAFRPETRLSSSVQNDAGVTAVYSYGELPRGRVPAQAIQAVITNNGALTQTNLSVTLNITGAETFTNTQIIPTLAGCGGQTIVTFAGFTPTKVGADTITVSVPSDDVVVNNSLSKAMTVTPNSYTYKTPGSTASGGVGLTGGVGAFIAKFNTSVATAISDVKLEFNSVTATTYRVAIYGDSGGVPSTTPLYVDAADRTVTAAGPVTIMLPTPVNVGPGNFYVGVQQTNTTNANVSFDNEAPVRAGSFYFATALPAATWIDLSPGNNFKLNIGVNLLTKSIADFDGDGKTDLSVFRRSEGNWYLNRSTAGITIVHWGNSLDTYVPSDFDGDNKADFAVWRPDPVDNQADFFILNSNGFTLSGYAFGLPGDKPLTGDYDGDGKADLACFRPSTALWYIYKTSSATVEIYQFGLLGDMPLMGDFNGDGKTDLVVFRPSDRFWYWNNATGTPAQNFGAMQWGLASDIPVPLDYDGDGKTDVAVWRPSNGTWYIVRSSDGAIVEVAFGMGGDYPVPGDYDGDGKNDIGVYRNGTWYVNRTTSGFLAQIWGAASDTPIPVAYHSSQNGPPLGGRTQP